MRCFALIVKRMHEQTQVILHFETHTQKGKKMKKRTDLDLSVKGSGQTEKSAVEMAASEQCHPCHHNKGVSFLSSTGKDVHKMRSAEQGSLIFVVNFH